MAQRYNGTVEINYRLLIAPKVLISNRIFLIHVFFKKQ